MADPYGAVTLVGSRAIKHWFPDFREPKDWDLLSGVDTGALSLEELPQVPAGHIDLFKDSRLAEWPWEAIATPYELYTLKISHIFWEINGPESWNKHAHDIIWLSRKGCRFLPDLYEILYPIWKDVQGGRKAKLRAASKKGFFKDAVVRKYDHDSLHRSVAYYETPMYEQILKDGSEVDCSWEKFQELPHRHKIKLCREEVYVTALERILIPAWDADQWACPRRAYNWALRRTITSLFTGKWALFMALNLDELFVPDVDYRARHRAGSDKLILLEDS